MNRIRRLRASEPSLAGHPFLALFWALVFLLNLFPASAQDLYSVEGSDILQLDSGLFRDWLTTVEGRQPDEAETAELFEIFRASREAYNAGIDAAQDKTGFRDQIFRAQSDELERFLELYPASAWAPSSTRTWRANTGGAASTRARWRTGTRRGTS